MDDPIKVALMFAVVAIVFLVIVYGVIKSPDKEAREKEQQELNRQMLEYFERENRNP